MKKKRGPVRTGAKDKRAQDRKTKPNPLEIAHEALERGFSPIPVEFRGKKPSAGEGWQKLRITSKTAADHFGTRNQNVGVLLGEPSGNIVDIDIDSDVALRLADELLPESPCMFGRAGKPKSHRLYTAMGITTEKFVDPTDREMLVEIRSTGSQTVYPGSTHPSGELVRWDSDGEPPPISVEILRGHVRRLAAATLLAKNWNRGSRDETATALSGAMLRAGKSASEVAKFLAAICRVAGDEQMLERLQKPERLARLLTKRTGRVPGKPTLRNAVAEKSYQRLCEWLELDEAPLARRLRSAAELVTQPVPIRWIHKPYLEEDVLALLGGKYGAFKTFLALDWALHAAIGKAWFRDTRTDLTPRTVVYISAEGRGLARRIRAWAKWHYSDRPVDSVLAKLPFYALEAAVNLSNEAQLRALCSEIDGLPDSPVMIVVDTLSRNSSGVEESNSETQVFLNSVNDSLRMRYRTSVLFIHHSGHTNEERVRGASSLIANTDSCFMVTKTGDWDMTLRTDRLKDSELPAGVHLEARVVETGTNDDEGRPETSLVLVPTGETFAPRMAPTGKHQVAVLSALRSDGAESWSNPVIREITRGITNDRKRVGEVLDSLKRSGWLNEEGGEWRLVSDVRSDPDASESDASDIPR